MRAGADRTGTLTDIISDTKQSLNIRSENQQGRSVTSLNIHTESSMGTYSPLWRSILGGHASSQPALRVTNIVEAALAFVASTTAGSPEFALLPGGLVRL